jgi:hypothetical protein
VVDLARLSRIAQAAGQPLGHPEPIVEGFPVYENLYILKQVIETSGVEAKPTTVAQDWRRLRDGLAKVKEFDGLLGKVTRLDERESVKPYVFAIAKNSDWAVLFDPR